MKKFRPLIHSWWVERWCSHYGKCGGGSSKNWKLYCYMLLGRKAMTNLHSMLKSRNVTLPAKVHLVKVMVFPVVVYGCESWTIKKAECWRIDAFELWCWKGLLRVPCTARGSNQSILKDSPECSLEGLTLKLKLQYFGHLMQRNDSLEKDPDAGKDWRREKKGTIEDGMVGWHHQLDAYESESSRSWWWTGKPGVLQSMGLQRVRHDWATELNWLLYDIAIPPLGEFKARWQRNTCIPMFVAALFAIISGGNPGVHQQKNDKQSVVCT